MSNSLLVKTLQKGYFKLLALLGVSYFFLGISEGSFFEFPVIQDTLLNFVFTLICVSSSWAVFKILFFNWIRSYGPYAIKDFLIRLSILGILLIYITVLNWLYIEIIWRESLTNTVFFSLIFPAAIVLFIFWIIGYEWYLMQSHVPKVNSQPSTLTIEAHLGNEKILKPINQILGFYINNGIVFLIDQESQKLMINQTLSELEEQTKPFGFFRANRQLLIARESVLSYRTEKNEKIKVTFSQNFNYLESSIISRYKAAEFRSWLNGKSAHLSD